MKRGPKPQTIRNSPQKAPRTIPLEQVEPTSTLNAEAMAEFRRLLSVLDNMGILERVDVSIVTEAARTKELLDRAYQLHERGIDAKAVMLVTQLTCRSQGLMRMLGLSVLPSRTHVHTVAKDTKQPATVAKLVRYPA